MTFQPDYTNYSQPQYQTGLSMAELAARQVEDRVAEHMEVEQLHQELAHQRGYMAGQQAAALVVGQALGEKSVEAEYDSLTTLRNRRMLISDIERRIEQGDDFMISFIDMDNFKAINDLFGHSLGDDYLRRLGKQFSQGLKRTSDAIRYGGDEMVILTSKPGNALRDQAHWVENEQQHIYDCIEAFKTEMIAAHPDHPLKGKIGMSMGSFVWTPEFTGTPDDLLQLADTAMYAAKQQRHQHQPAHRREPGVLEP